MEKFNKFAIKAQLKMGEVLAHAKKDAVAFACDEDGDTNFISILVLLGIALALAGIFLAFKDQVLSWVEANIGDFFSLSGGR